jgi:hypothetical protein
MHGLVDEGTRESKHVFAAFDSPAGGIVDEADKRG